MAASQAAASLWALAGLIAAVDADSATQLAATLIHEFGTLPAVLAASNGRLATVIPDHPEACTLIVSAHRLMREALTVAIDSAPILPGSAEVMDYLYMHMAHEPAEQLRVLYLDTKNRLLRDDIATRGTINRADIFPREIVRRALDLGATGIILAHNHPSGDPRPSSGDLSATRAVAAASELFDITLHDHIIIGRNGWRSLRNDGYL